MLHVICCMKWVRNSCCRKRLPNTVWWDQWSPETPLAELFYTYLLNCLFNWWTQMQQILTSPCQHWGGGYAAPADSGADASVRLAGRTSSTRLQQNRVPVLYIFAELVDSYSSAPYWKNFSFLWCFRLVNCIRWVKFLIFSCQTIFRHKNKILEEHKALSIKEVPHLFERDNLNAVGVSLRHWQKAVPESVVRNCFYADTEGV